ncbi:MAG: YicC/YloC family endoribonuclease [Alkalispirochaeta sp.]
MIRSMTGYAYVERATDERTLSVEIRSVNNRYLEVYPSLPSVLAPMDPEIRKIVSARALRGKVEVNIRLREYADTIEISVDPSAVRSARAALDEIAAAAGIEGTPTFSDILAFEGVIHTERSHDLDRYRELLRPVFDEALDKWDETRESEGTATVDDIRRQVQRLENSIGIFAARASEVETVIVQSVRDRFREILGEEVEEQRVIAEAAVLAIKHGTNEEMVRLRSHLDTLRTLLDTGGSIGKRLDFVCQEINREINTTGSKTIFPEVQNAAVEAKDAVEAIREQVRNIE